MKSATPLVDNIRLVCKIRAFLKAPWLVPKVRNGPWLQYFLQDRFQVYLLTDHSSIDEHQRRLLIWGCLTPIHTRAWMCSLPDTFPLELTWFLSSVRVQLFCEFKIGSIVKKFSRHWKWCSGACHLRSASKKSLASLLPHVLHLRREEVCRLLSVRAKS